MAEVQEDLDSFNGKVSLEDKVPLEQEYPCSPLEKCRDHFIK